MVSSPINNALLRIDGATGELSPPFERPNDKMSFWVLEITIREAESIISWCSRAARILKSHAKLLDQLHKKGAHLTLFIESSADVPVFRLEAEFLAILADQSISLEHYQVND